jgi:predicted nucleic acid-binding protein
MILVDTSVWIEHLRRGDEALVALLNRAHVSTHPFVIGELACGNLRKRDEILRLLNGLPQAPIASQDEVLFFIDRNRLMGRGIGLIDAHLLAASALDDDLPLWTRDKRLQKVAVDLNLDYRT